MSVLTPALRERLYTLVAPIVAVLVAAGLLDTNTAALWASFGVASVTLLFALANSTSQIRTALYTFLVAAQALAAVYGILSADVWASVLALAATLLGVTVAAAKTPTPIES